MLSSELKIHYNSDLTTGLRIYMKIAYCTSHESNDVCLSVVGMTFALFTKPHSAFFRTTGRVLKSEYLLRCIILYVMYDVKHIFLIFSNVTILFFFTFALLQL